MGYSMLDNVLSVAIEVILIVISVMIHEVSHGWVAHLLGDDTAKRAGRLTLNPTAHLDPVGSVILPAAMLLLGGPVFAFAKPVPYNPNNLKHPRRDEVLVALAGPLSNFLQACVGAAIFRGLYALWGGSVDFLYFSLTTAMEYVYLNLSLMLFNLIPLPPLDGSSIISPLLSGKARKTYYTVQQYSMPILLILLYALPYVLGFNPLGIYLSGGSSAIANFLLGA